MLEARVRTHDCIALPSHAALHGLLTFRLHTQTSQLPSNYLHIRAEVSGCGGVSHGAVAAVFGVDPLPQEAPAALPGLTVPPGSEGSRQMSPAQDVRIVRAMLCMSVTVYLSDLPAHDYRALSNTCSRRSHGSSLMSLPLPPATADTHPNLQCACLNFCVCPFNPFSA